MNSPLVSIIIPVYNAASHLEQCLQSAVNQTWKKKEIILVNDGSTDQSIQIAKRYENEYCKIITQENKGAAAARNTGIKHAKGSYIQFLDADDILSLDKIENQVKLIGSQLDKLVVCNTVQFYDGEEHLNLAPNPMEDNYIFSTNDPIAFLTNLWGLNDGHIAMVQPNAWLTPSNLIAKVGLWNEHLSLDDDGDFFCRILLNSKGIIKDRSSINYYRKYKRPKSVSGAMTSRALQSQLEALNSKKEQLLKKADNVSTRTALANLYLSLSMISFRNDKAVYLTAKMAVETIGVKPSLKIVMGGNFIQLITKIFGWRTARIISSWKRNIANQI
ncbi:glycosyltransferase family 2 protein [Pedobacter namyangjuensis]|uniref:glycosyltransferase family 2 protein n=1 Tax=Pedobacter namyangjuensis TaxID=600626 RepID=UPI000DE5623B|nr:glycosyltransferase family 2 protein [Pedobacter namyangjuensis]